MKAHRLVLFLIILGFLISPLLSAIIVNPPAIPRDFTSAGTYYHSSGNLAYFAVDHTMTFTQVVLDSTYVEFNNTKFNISSLNRINISLNYLSASMTGASGTTLISFYAQTTTGNAGFNISGLTSGLIYRIYKNNASLTTATANTTGWIHFDNSVGASAYLYITLIGTLPTVTTNAATGVEETNATVSGTITGLAGEIPSNYGFNYGTTVSYGTDITSTSLWSNFTTFSDGNNMHINDHVRFAKKWTAFTGVPMSASFYIKKVGNPVDNMLVRIRYVSNDSIHETGTLINANTLNNTYTWITFNFNRTSTIMGADIYISFEYVTGDAANYVKAGYGGAVSNSYEIKAPPPYTWNPFFGGTLDLKFNYRTSYSSTFNYNLNPLAQGTLYHYRAFATNGNGTGYGLDKRLLTKPNEPTAFSATQGNKAITLSWTHGTGYNKSVVRGKVGAYPTSVTDGTSIYNSTGNSITHSGLAQGAVWYYRVWEYANESGLHQFSDTYSQVHALVITTSVVTTNASTGIEETNATFRGFLANNGSTANTCGFLYDTDSGFPYAHNQSLGIIGNHSVLTYNKIGLLQGHMYYFRAWSSSSTGFVYGNERYFLTKPDEPFYLHATNYNETLFYLVWSVGSGMNTTVIQRSTTTMPTTHSSGTNVYNGTGTWFKNDGLIPGRVYCYNSWSFTQWNTSHQWSDLNSSVYLLTYPYKPTNCSASINSSTASLYWTKGIGSNRTIIVKNIAHPPTSVTDGTIIYNGTGHTTTSTIATGITNYYAAFGYKNFTINPTLHHFSLNYSSFSITGGGLMINCFDENDHHNLTFNVKVSNQSGSKVYENTSCTNTLVINATLCPQGPNIQIIVSATGYHQRIYTLDIYSGIIHLLNAYLPPETAPGNGTENCELRAYIDSMTITNPAIDAVVTLTYPLEDMISVEIYNASLYGTYGGWIFVASDKYSFTTTSVTINETVLDANTTMARVSYYYNFCEGGVESTLYNLQVVETILTSYAQVDQAVENVLMQVKRYINSTGTFVDVSSIFTDSNGIVNIYLVPNAHYKIFLNKSGYVDSIGDDYYPTPPNAAGQTEPKVFRIVKIAGYIPQDIYNPLQVITFNGYVDHATHILYVNYSDSLCATINVNISVYEYNASTNLSSLLGYFFTTSCNFQHSFNNINDSNRYTVVMSLNHTYFGYLRQSFSFNAIAGWMALIAYTTPSYMNRLWDANYGTNPLGWSNCVMFIIMILGLFWGGRDELPLVFISLGVIFQGINLGIGFFTLSQFASSVIPITFIIAGILAAWQRRA